MGLVVTTEGIVLNEPLRLGPYRARLILKGEAGHELDAKVFERRLGPLRDPEPLEELDEDLLVSLRSTQGPWPKPNQPVHSRLAPLWSPKGWTLRRSDLEADLAPMIYTVEGECAPTLKAAEACLMFLVWLLGTSTTGTGLLLRAACTVHEGVARCFPGYERGGKSTLVDTCPGELALSDDVVLLTLEQGQWRAWPSPFFSWERQLSQGVDPLRGFPVASVSFLQPAPMTRFEPLRPDEALTRLMEHAVTFDAFARNSSRTFELAAELAQAMSQRGALGVLHLRKGCPPYPSLP